MDVAGKIVVSLGDNLSEILSIERGRATNRALHTLCWQSLAWQLYSDIDWRRRHVPSANNVADAASQWADAGLLSPGSVLTPNLQSIGPHAKRAGEDRRSARGEPIRRPTKKFSRAPCGKHVFKWRGAVEQAGRRPSLAGQQ